MQGCRRLIVDFALNILYGVVSGGRVHICTQCWGRPYQHLDKAACQLGLAGKGSGSRISYREFIECRYIGLFRISKSISYRTSHIEYLDILKTNDFFVFFRRKFQKFSENSENSPKIQKTHEPKSSTTTTAPKIPKIRRKF